MANSNNICFYPKLTDELFNYIFDEKNTKITFLYTVNDETRPIAYTDDNDNISFDNSTDWNCDDYDLDVIIDIKLNDLDKLFGVNGIAPLNSKIGLCIEWYSAQSKIRKVVNYQDFITKSDSEKTFKFEFTLPKQTFNGSLSINVLLYLAESADDVLTDEVILNNNVGVVIGNLMKKVIFMTGDGSQFPIKVISLPESNRLWKLELDLDDPGSKQVSDGLTLILNSAHKNYKFIDPNSKEFCECLTDEIVTNALTLFLNELSKSSEFDLEGNYDDGTLLAYAKYCKDKLDINFNSLMDISSSLHDFSEKGD